MRFFSTPSVGLYAAGLVVASGCSLIASPDESLLDGVGGDAQSSASVGGLPSANSSSASTTTTSSSSPTSSSTSSGEQGGGGSGPSSSSASQGGGGSTSDGGGGSTSDGGGGSTSDGGGGSTSDGGGGSGGGTGGAGGGTGGGPECTTDPETECPPTGNECILPVCDGDDCATENAPPNTPLSIDLNVGNCKANICDGDGGVDEVNDDDDAPADDECVAHGCDDGDVTDTAINEGDDCGQVGSGLTCQSGVCKGCTIAADCGTPATCQVFTCSLDGECISGDADNGTPIADADENCQRVECQDGAPEIVADPADPDDDQNDCTIDDCNGTTPRHTAEDGGTPCDGGFCNGTTAANACRECFADNDCGLNNGCTTNDCTAGFTCAAEVVIPNGQELNDPTNNDCLHTECQGGVPQLGAFEDAGTTCTISGGTRCDVAGNCVTDFCDDNADCNGLDSFCLDVTCNTGAARCTTSTPQNVGTTVPPDSGTDCTENFCTAAGAVSSRNDNTEVPVADANPCTQEVCLDGTPHPPVATNGPCIGQAGFCTATQVCVECTLDAQCPSGSCDETDNTCDAVAPTCSDVIENQDETDVDCGGVICDGCDDGLDCLLDSDCENDFCRPDTDECATPTCSDGFQNQDETDLNCGGICGANCALGDTCADDGDCASGECNTTNFTCSLAAAFTFINQNFDALPNSGTPTLPDFVTALGGPAVVWVLNNSNSTAQFGAGTVATGGVYSFGAAASNERALGALASGTTGSNAMGICFTNTTGAILTNVNVAYNGEQWRNGGNVTAQTLTFSFSTFSDFTGGLSGAEIQVADNGNDATGWEAVSALSFTSPVATATAAPVDGNVAGRLAITGQVPGLTLANNAAFCVRWLDANDTGNDHGLALDDLVITGL